MCRRALILHFIQIQLGPVLNRLHHILNRFGSVPVIFDFLVDDSCNFVVIFGRCYLPNHFSDVCDFFLRSRIVWKSYRLPLYIRSTSFPAYLIVHSFLCHARKSAFRDRKSYTSTDIILICQISVIQKSTDKLPCSILVFRFTVDCKIRHISANIGRGDIQ